MAESHKKVTVPTTAEIGQPRIISSSYFIQDSRKSDLIVPTRFQTFDRMCEDDAVYNAYDLTNLLFTIAMQGGSFKSKGSKVAADFLNYNLRNMSYGTWLDAVNTAGTSLKYGFALMNLVMEKRKFGKYKGSHVIRKLSPRSPKSLVGWVWNENQSEVLGVVQQPRIVQLKPPGYYGDGLSRLAAGKLVEQGYPYMSLEQLLHFTHNGTMGNPQGDSPLAHCYNAWKEKKLIEKYEVIGISKDLGGAVVLRVPSELIEQANDPITYPEAAAEYAQLQDDAARLHAGENSYIVLTSDVDPESKMRLFDFELKGIDGGGKQYSTDAIIEQKRKSIYNVFGAGHVLLGQSTTGSYGLKAGGAIDHSYFVERCIMQASDVLNNQLAPRVLAANNIYLDYDKMPVFEAAEPSEFDPDVMSKVIQRVQSVGGMTKEALTHLYELSGWPTEGLEDLDLTSDNQSQAGMGDGTAGKAGEKQGDDNSVSNNENGGATQKSFVFQEESDDQIILIDTKTGKPMFIDKE